MAGSRLDRIGNLFSRMTGLLRTGAIKYEERPVWYDIYRVFPPKYEPRVDREIDEGQVVQQILYDEDLIRAKIFKKYGANPGGMVRNLSSSPTSEEDACQKLVNAFNAARKANPELTDDDVFKSVSNTFVFPSTQYRRQGPPRQRIRESSTTDSPQPVATRRPLQSENFYDEDVLFETETDTLNDQYRRKTKIVTAESLLALFQEAKSTGDKKEKPTSGTDGKAEKSKTDE